MRSPNESNGNSLESDLRSRLTTLETTCAELRKRLKAQEADADFARNQAQELSLECSRLQHDVRVWTNAEHALRSIVDQRDRIILMLRQRLGTLEDSNGRQLGLLFARTVKRPYRFFLLPIGLTSLVIRAVRRAWLKRRGRLPRRLAAVGTTVTPPRESPAGQAKSTGRNPQLTAPHSVAAESNARVVEGSNANGAHTSGMSTGRAPAAGASTPPISGTEPDTEADRFLLEGCWDFARLTCDLRVLSILDEFSQSCFEPDCNLIPVRPDNWDAILRRARPHFLLVESAWKGNQGSWEYRVASYDYPGREELERLVSTCRQSGIPTAFWNKEDPVHFQRFLATAGLFDVVFTSDADCIPAYRRAIGHDRVFALPFAAQPRLHHPGQVTGHRQGSVCFAGSYYGNRHPQRRQELEWLLDAALPFGLRIYDRNHGQQSSNDFRFPERFSAAINGGLPYREMVQAYKQYKVFLNVNSVVDSPTMFSRRVFELMACGTPIVSVPARGISELLGDEAICTVDSPQRAHDVIRKLLEDEEYWDSVSLNGQRVVHASHTYAHRLQYVAARLGFDVQLPPPPKVTGVTWVDRDVLVLVNLAESLRAQRLPVDELLVVCRADHVDRIAELLSPSIKELVPMPVASPTDGASWWSSLLKRASGELFALLCPTDHYGPHYLADLVRAHQQTRADVVGKRTHYARNGQGAPQLDSPGQEHAFVDGVLPAASLARRDCLEALGWPDRLDLHDTGYYRAQVRAGGRVYSVDRFNYLRDGAAADRRVDC